MDRLGTLTASFAGLRVLVVGDAMLDRYLSGAAHRLCPEAPVPVVDVTERREAPGGAANTALNAAALGAGVSLVALLGGDAEGARLASALSAAGVDLGPCVGVEGRSTLVKQRVAAGGQVLLRLDEGDVLAPDEAAQDRVGEMIGEAWDGHDAVVVSDYAYGAVTPAVIAALGRVQRRSPKVLVADSKHLTGYRHVGVSAVKPNYAGAVSLLGEEAGSDGASRADALAARGERMLALSGARIAAVTLDAEGAIVFERDRAPYRTYARTASSAGPSGAGDTYTCAFALALAAGADTPEAAEIAQAAASVVVAQPGTSTCRAEELAAAIGGLGKAAGCAEEAARRLEPLRASGGRVVLTNGCFDILHRGHVTYLSQAKSLGDVLVVGVNCDEGVRRLKGPGRPVNQLEDRMHVLEALSCVDLVVPFAEDTPHALISAVRPDVFVKGGDYTLERLPEAELVRTLGGEVRLLPCVQDRSTSGLIDRIRTEEPRRTSDGR
ncbi:MAG: D-glycero-beta-D-manno-heptose 1-phosphate adenylyltransferase [Coriobacteriia bacterium]|nr:D-glycero-beta-D-manno-heptose 1-phosphate adenylyltransferase [Coriobacteriia bacterium]